MKTKLNKTITSHPKARYTREGIKLKWANLEPRYKKQFGILLSNGEGSIIMEKGKKYFYMNRW